MLIEPSVEKNLKQIDGLKIISQNPEEAFGVNYDRYYSSNDIQSFLNQSGSKIECKKNFGCGKTIFTISSKVSHYPYSIYTSISLDSKIYSSRYTSSNIDLLNGKCLVLSIDQNKNYGHALLEVLPFLLYLSEHEKGYSHIITSETEVLKNVIKDLDIKLSDRIKFIKQEYKFTCDELTFLPIYESGSLRDFNLIKNFKNKLDLIDSNTENQKDKIIYCLRSDKAAKHGRKMNKKNESEIIKELDFFCKKNKKYELCIFDSLDDNGETLTPKQQFDLFKSAKIIIGAHGTAMYNSIFARSGVKICEFTGGKNGINGDKSFKNFNRTVYFDYFGIKDKIDYYSIPFDPNSNINDCSIDLKNLREFLLLIENQIL